MQFAQNNYDYAQTLPWQMDKLKLMTLLPNITIRPSQSPATRRVAILVDIASGWGRSIVEGVGDYCRENQWWELYLNLGGESNPHELPANWQGDGIIARVTSQAHRQKLEAHNIPLVNVSSVYEHKEKLVTVLLDSQRIAEMAVTHFQELGLPHIAYIGVAHANSSRLRKRQVAELARKAKLNFSTFDFTLGVSTSQAAAQRTALCQWILKQPKPLGILAWNDNLGKLAIDAAHLSGVSLPDEVAILGVDNDELICHLTIPTMSSIETGVHRLGYTAAQLLHNQMTNPNSVRPGIRLLDPIGIIPRESTDMLATDDPIVNQALRQIRKHMDRPILVNDLALALGISKRKLEMHFAAAMNHSPATLIKRIKLEKIRSLLLDSDLTIEEIAQKTGFAYVENMIPLFRRKFGKTPAQYRRSQQHHTTHHTDNA